tara:strand:+ start:8862 stop:9065 length:204 start_codon:yes stop_codon:yes gene_type:complete
LNIELANYLLPESILDYFEIKKHGTKGDTIHFYLKEKNILLEEYQSNLSHSKDFSPEITIEDFPFKV